MEIYLNNNQTELQVNENDWIDFSEKILRLLDSPEDTELSLTFVNNEEIHKLNKEYRQKDYATDVLSFPFENEFNLPINNILGDIIISLQKAESQAQEYGHSFNRELGFLIVHGILHLNGYDHETKEDEEKMFSLQKKLLLGFDL